MWTKQTHATLAPDTAKLKPASLSPFDIPLIAGLNFLSMSVVNKENESPIILLQWKSDI